MADHWSLFGKLSPETTRAAMSYSYFAPLYPLMLSFVGGTIEHVELAHAVTITFFSASLVFFFMWAWRETENPIQSFLLTAIFAFLPTTFFQSFGILSENLYLLLTLMAVWMLTQLRISLPQLYIVSIVVGLLIPA